MLSMWIHMQVLRNIWDLATSDNKLKEIWDMLCLLNSSHQLCSICFLIESTIIKYAQHKKGKDNSFCLFFFFFFLLVSSYSSTSLMMGIPGIKRESGWSHTVETTSLDTCYKKTNNLFCSLCKPQVQFSSVQTVNLKVKTQSLYSGKDSVCFGV